VRDYPKAANEKGAGQVLTFDFSVHQLEMPERNVLVSIDEIVKLAVGPEDNFSVDLTSIVDGRQRDREVPHKSFHPGEGPKVKKWLIRSDQFLLPFDMLFAPFYFWHFPWIIPVRKKPIGIGHEMLAHGYTPAVEENGLELIESNQLDVRIAGGFVCARL
jgi:hypothetical protein